MRIVHLRFPRAGPSLDVAACAQLSKSPGLLAHAPLRQKGSSGVALLFREQDSANNFRHLLELIKADGSRYEYTEYDASAAETLKRPVFLVGAPRSGTTLVFETLSQCANAWTIGSEDHTLIEFARRASVENGNRLEARDADPELCEVIRGAFFSVLRNRDRSFLVAADSASHDIARVRFLEKTPKNSLRISFLRAVFPDCRFVFLYRSPGPNIGSLIDGWNSKRYNTYRLEGSQWKFLLPPDWSRLVGKPVVEIAAAQWRAANGFILADLGSIPPDDWCIVRYEHFVSQPASEVRRIAEFADLEVDERLENLLVRPLPPSQSTLTPPSSDKWLRHADSLAGVLPAMADIEAAVAAMEQSRLPPSPASFYDVRADHALLPLWTYPRL